MFKYEFRWLVQRCPYTGIIERTLQIKTKYYESNLGGVPANESGWQDIPVINEAYVETT